MKYRAGESAFLFCKSEVDKDLTTTRQWYKDGVLVPDNDDRVFLKDSKRVDKSIPMSHTLQVMFLFYSAGYSLLCIKQVSVEAGQSLQTWSQLFALWL